MNGRIGAGAAALALVAALAFPARAAADAAYAFVNVYSGRCLDAAAGQLGSNGTRVQLWDCYGDGQFNQRWYVEPLGMDGTSARYQIINKASGRCLDATAEWGGVDGTPVQLWDCYGAGQTNQLWYWKAELGGVYLQNVAYGRVLDATWQWGGANGTPVQLWDNYGPGQTNQRWDGFPTG
ncbi:RICIN domain-containing protein [Amycolatopsis sp. NPDC059090]|uniref:RICIN domain-containing protein n=1 Tax=Amycolatopsis sp. NPDC059090 TaxID=3346723 RepID=UPI00366EC263